MLSQLSLSIGTDLHKAVLQKGEAAVDAFVPWRGAIVASFTVSVSDAIA
jgi:hypothetical protein